MTRFSSSYCKCQQTAPYLKGLVNMYMCMKFEFVSTYDYLDIEVYANIFRLQVWVYAEDTGP